MKQLTKEQKNEIVMAYRQELERIRLHRKMFAQNLEMAMILGDDKRASEVSKLLRELDQMEAELKDTLFEIHATPVV